jgi:hypothetical protein
LAKPFPVSIRSGVALDRRDAPGVEREWRRWLAQQRARTPAAPWGMAEKQRERQARMTRPKAREE